MSDIPFLRSINIAQDALHPERVMHFRPTAKCINLINRLLGEQSERAYFIVAPYGSGKSLACTYLLHLIENSSQQLSRELLRTIATRIKDVDPGLAEFARKRAGSKRRGLVIVLEGSLPNVAESLQVAAVAALRRCKLGRQARPIESLDTSKPGAIVELLSLIAEKAKAAKLDRVAIVWDEFGRHLEGLVSTGRATELSEVQLLAETISRTSALPVTLGVIMHQGFANYASGLPQAIQAEWKKVEGRFSPIQYVDDSMELYELLGSIVKSRRTSSAPQTKWPDVARAVQEAGLFAPFSTARLKALLEASWPVEPTVIYLLPRLAARTAQNERTMFGFVYSRSLDTPVDTDDLYEYFAPTMELDRGVGGTYRTWLETESACAKAESALEVSLLRLTSLLTMALTEERGRLKPKMLENAACLGRTDRQTVKASLRGLLARKLLLYRKHANQVSLWHGTDIDLRNRIEAERGKLLADFSLEEFLGKEFPPPIWKPVAYNDDMALRRYFRSRFVLASNLRTELQSLVAAGGLPPDADGEIWYIVTVKNADLSNARDSLGEFNLDARLLIAIPELPPNLIEPAIELLALQRLLLDEELVSDDPLATNEIGQMVDDVQKHLARLVDQIVVPRGSGVQWLHQGKTIAITNSKTLRTELSRITGDNYSQTPRINSEMITRRQPSATIVNARKKVCLGILERYGQEKLGLEGEFADSAILRSVLLATGLYRRDQQEDIWRFARPDELQDPCLRAVWQRFETFFTEPSKVPKRVSELFEPLQRPPIGLRAGLFPVLFAAAVRAFPSAYSITRRDGGYISDLLPSEVEMICKDPQAFFVFVPELTPESLNFLENLCAIFSTSLSETTPQSSLIRDIHEAMEDWLHTLPRGALTSRHVSAECRSFQRALRSVGDPQRLLLKDLPALGKALPDSGDLPNHIARWKAELEDMSSVYAREAGRLITRALDDGTPKASTNVLLDLEAWLEALPPNLLDTVSTLESKNFLRGLTVRFTSESVAIERIAVACTGQTFQYWTDESIREFREIFVRKIETIEAEVIQGSNGESEAVKTYILRTRINRLATTLAEEIGASGARAYIEQVADQLIGQFGVRDGDHSRRIGNG